MMRRTRRAMGVPAGVLAASLAWAATGADFSAAKDAFETAYASAEKGKKLEALRAFGEADCKETAEFLLNLADRSSTRLFQDLETKSLALQKQYEEILKTIQAMIAPARTQPSKLREYKEQKDALTKKSIEIQKEMSALETEIQTELELQDRMGTVLGALKDDGAQTAILDAAVKEDRWRVRLVACRALGRLKDAGATGCLGEVLGKDGEEAVRLTAAEMLGVRGDKKGVPSLVEAVRKEKAWQLRVVAAESLAKIDSADAVGPLIEALADLDGLPKVKINDALIKLTGEARAANADAWKAWWEGVKADYGTTRPSKEKRATEVKAQNDPGRSTFYGVPVVSKRIAFAVDFSGSMAAKAKWKPAVTESGPTAPKHKLAGDRRTDVARYELCNAIEKLGEDVEFNVYLFNRLPNPLFPELRRATAATKKAAIQTVQDTKLAPNTNIFDTLEACFPKVGAGGVSFKGSAPDTIYLLSDGAPVGGQVTSMNGIRARIQEMNRSARITIHTVAIEPGKNQAAFMKKLAEENGGTSVER